MAKGQCDDIQESAILEGYRCKDDGCGGFLIRDPGKLFGEFCLFLVGWKCLWSIISLWICAGDKGFICQHCGLVRDKEEITKIASETKLLSEKASRLASSGRIL